MKKSRNSFQRFVSGLFSVLMICMLVSTVFIPAVSAESIKHAVEEYPMELIRSTETAKEYMMYSDAEKTKAEYFVRTEQTVIDNKLVTTAKLYAVNPDGSISPNAEIGNDSYQWTDEDGGLHIHIGPNDLEVINSGQLGVTKSFSILLKALGTPGNIVGTLIRFFATNLIDIQNGLFCNADGSLDIYLDQLTQTLIPVYLALPGVQYVVIRLGTIDVPYAL